MSCIYGNFILIFAGVNDFGRVLNHIDVYDIVKEEWSSLSTKNSVPGA